MKFKIVIEETVEQEFEVEADTAEKALDIAREKYLNGEFVLEPGDCSSRVMCVKEPKNKETEWYEF